jgi:hypothetical protein
MLKRKKILEYQVLSVSDFGGLQLWEIIQALQKYPEQARVSVDYPYEYSCDLMIKWLRDETDEEFAKRKLHWERDAPKRAARAQAAEEKKRRERAAKEGKERKLFEKLQKKYGEAK